MQLIQKSTAIQFSSHFGQRGRSWCNSVSDHVKRARKAYHLVQIDHSFHALDIASDRLRSIWTKLAHLASRVDADNVEEWLGLAETVTVHGLKMLLRSAEPDPDTRAVIMYLDTAQYDVFEKALLTAGAVKHSRGLLHKEETLITLLSASLAS